MRRVSCAARLGGAASGRARAARASFKEIALRRFVGHSGRPPVSEPPSAGFATTLVYVVCGAALVLALIVSTAALTRAADASPKLAGLWKLNEKESESFQQKMQELRGRSEEHTSELQSQFHLVCRLLLEKKKSRLR